MKDINTTFNVLAPRPFDGRIRVNTYAELATIPVKYIGLKTYVVDEDKDYRYKSTGWVPIPTGGGSASWGSIGGDINTQTDLMAKLNDKFNVSGGTITGDVLGQGIFEAVNFILLGSEDSVPGESYIPYVGASTDIDINNKLIETTLSNAQLNTATGGVLITKNYLNLKIQESEDENLQKAISGSYSLTNADHQYVIFIDNGAANIVITIPTGLRENFCVGLVQRGVGNVQIIGDIGVTLRSPSGFNIKGVDYCMFIEKYLTSEEYHILGNTKV